MIKFEQKGDFSKLDSFLEKAKHVFRVGLLDTLNKYGKDGVIALQAATPKDTGKTSESWSYTIVQKPDRVSIEFHNSNINQGVPIAVILQYGHATRNGGWVQGIDYINPALRPIFEKIADDAWKEVTKA